MTAFLFIIMSISIILLIITNVVLWVTVTGLADSIKDLEREDIDIDRTYKQVEQAHSRISKLAIIQSGFISHVTGELMKVGSMK